MIKCAKCEKVLAKDAQGEPIPFICGSIMGDEYIESWYFCPSCQMYSVENYHDRFMGEDSISITGPIDKTTGDARISIIKRCPEPSNKRCRCPAHKEYFGSFLD